MEYRSDKHGSKAYNKWHMENCFSYHAGFFNISRFNTIFIHLITQSDLRDFRWVFFISWTEHTKIT